jgi:hypothetical protein
MWPEKRRREARSNELYIQTATVIGLYFRDRHGGRGHSGGRLDVQETSTKAKMTDEKPDKARIHNMKNIAACIFGLFLVCCGATPPTNLAVLIALTAPTPTMISESEPTKKKGARAK